MYKTWILVILLSTALFSSSGYTETEKKGKSWKGTVSEVAFAESFKADKVLDLSDAG